MNVYTAKDLMDEAQNVNTSTSLILTVFTHPACSGCGPAVEMGWEIAQEMEGIELKTVKLESREGLEKAKGHSIKTIPTMIISRGGEEFERVVGLPNREEFKETLKRHLIGI